MGEASKETTGIQCDKSQIGVGTGGCGNTHPYLSIFYAPNLNQAEKKGKPTWCHEPRRGGPKPDRQ